MILVILVSQFSHQPLISNGSFFSSPLDILSLTILLVIDLADCHFTADCVDTIVTFFICASFSLNDIPSRFPAGVFLRSGTTYQTHTLKNLLTVFLHSRQGSVVSFPATPYACKRAGRKCIHNRHLPAYP